MNRRGFALPLVVLMSLVATLLVAFSLDRSLTQAYSVNRQVERYSTHHFAKGLETLIESFSRSVSNRSMAEVLDPSGLAMRVVTDDGAGLLVSFFDGQDTLLEAFDGLGRDDRMMGEGALVRMIESAGAENVRNFTRAYGPLAVSINSSSEEVLRAALDAALLGEDVDRTLSALLQARRSAANGVAMTREEMSFALEAIGVDPQLRSRVERLVTAQPVLWRFVVEPEDQASSAGGVTIRYEGVAIIAPPSADRGSNVPKGAGAVMEIHKVELPNQE